MKKQIIKITALFVVFVFAACSSKVVNTPPVLNNITQNDIDRYESTIKEYGQKIKDFKPREFTKEELEKLNAGEDVQDPTTPNIDWFTEKSNAERMLGKNLEAIKTLEESLKYFENSTVSWSNLGAIYAEFGDCKNAEKYYDKVVDFFGGERGSNYLMYPARCYYREGNTDKVQDIVSIFKQMGGTNIDPEIKDYLDEKNTETGK